MLKKTNYIMKSKVIKLKEINNIRNIKWKNVKKTNYIIKSKVIKPKEINSIKNIKWKC